jgi:hypothetical protein
MILLLGSPLRAQEVDGFVELVGSSSTQETRVTGDLTREVDSSSFFQRYSANARWLLYPNFSFNVGALYERDESLGSSDDESPDVTRERLRPFVSFALGTRFFSADVGFYRLEDRVGASGFDSRETRDTVNATLNWRPADLPSWTLYAVRNDTYDRNRESLDLEDSIVDLSMRWQPIDTLDVQYRGGIQNTDNRLEDVELQLFSQTGRLSYNDVFWDRRLLVAAEYNVNYQKTTVERGGASGGEAPVPVLPAAGLSLNDDFPRDGALALNPALSDGDRTTSAGINLGLPLAGGDDALRNLGLDFTVPANVDSLEVSVDQLLPPEISSVFVWQVYSSADNEQWELEGEARATFSRLDNRFELQFDDVEARYVKVVTAPLDIADPSADQFTSILVTELEAFDRVAASDTRTESSMTTHRVNGNARVKLLPAENLYYDFSFYGIGPDFDFDTYSVTNAISYGRQLDRVVSVAARVARENSRDVYTDSVSYPYSASLRAGWLPTLRQTLVFSGYRTDFDSSSTSLNSLLLQTSADLYKGIGLELGLGTNRRTTDGEDTDSDQLTATLFFLPHPKLTTTLLYQLRKTDRPGEDSRDPSVEKEFDAREISISYRPFPALYLSGSYRHERQDPAPNRRFGNYGISWSPFPSGSLQITLRYDGTDQSQFDTKSTTASATVRWNLPKGRWLEAGGLRNTLDTDVDSRVFDTLQANLRWTF